LSEYKKF